RRHMKHLRHPIIGDTSHGDGHHNIMFRENFANTRLLLHAAYLSFKHPQTEQLIEINATIDDLFSGILKAINLELHDA
ncbi:MAG: pseudouridylate synthase, partial [Psychromonas sp.]